MEKREHEACNFGAVIGGYRAFAGLGRHEHAAEPDTVDVNTADAATIADVLVGVGLRKAAAIVRYREEHGRFSDICDLTRVRGIGEATVTKNESRIDLGE